MGKYEELFNQSVKNIDDIAIGYCKETDGAFSILQFNKKKGFEQYGAGDPLDYFVMAMGLLEIIYDKFNDSDTCKEHGRGKMPVDIFATIISHTFIEYMKEMGGGMQGISFNLGRFQRGDDK